MIEHTGDGVRDRVFILRFWLEPSGENGRTSSWRAKITDVGTNSESHASDVEKALEHVRRAMRCATD